MKKRKHHLVISSKRDTFLHAALAGKQTTFEDSRHKIMKMISVRQSVLWSDVNVQFN